MTPTRPWLLAIVLAVAWALSPSPASAFGWKVYAADGQGNYGWSARPIEGDYLYAGVPKREALQGCGTPQCQIVMLEKAECMAFAESREGGYWYGHAAGAQINFVIRDALQFCKQPTCRIVHTNCS